MKPILLAACASALGPFATLLGLVYSTILSNIYAFYLSRQELILSNLFAEAYAVRDLYELSGTLGNYSVSTTLALRAHALELRETGERVRPVRLLPDGRLRVRGAGGERDLVADYLL